jgi:hypothetical protein
MAPGGIGEGTQDRLHPGDLRRLAGALHEQDPNCSIAR